MPPSRRSIATGGFARGPRGAWSWAPLVSLGLCFAVCGCRTLSARRGPVPRAVAQCRQLTEQGISAMERGDWKRAESLLSRAVESCNSDPDARRQYAEALWHRGALHEALAQLEEARGLVTTDPALAVRAGEVHLQIGQLSQAQAMAEEALSLDPKFATAWALRGRVAAALGKPRAALGDYQRALGYAPDDHEMAILVAEAYRQLNLPQRALVALQSIGDKYAPGDQPQRVLYLEGLALVALGRYDEATSNLTQAARKDRPSAKILCALAEAQLLAGNVATAQSSVQEALALEPGHAASRALSARIAATRSRGRPVTR